MALKVKVNIDDSIMIKKLLLKDYEPVYDTDKKTYVIYIYTLPELIELYRVLKLPEDLAEKDFRKYKRKLDKMDRKQKKEDKVDRKIKKEVKVVKESFQKVNMKLIDDINEKIQYKFCLCCRTNPNYLINPLVFYHNCCENFYCQECYGILISKQKNYCEFCNSRIKLSE